MAREGSALSRRRTVVDREPTEDLPLDLEGIQAKLGGVTQTPPRGVKLVYALTLSGFGTSLVAAMTSAPLSAPAQWGFLKAIPILWYIGLALVCVGFVLSRRSGDPRCVAFAAITIVLVMSGTQSVVYQLPRYSWVFNHISISEYIAHYGHLPPTTGEQLDIYNAWPGFFAFFAALGRVGGVQDPTAIARWFPPVIDLLTLFAARAFAGRFHTNSVFRPWFAAVMLFLANNLGDDPHYFSPQSMAYTLGIITITLAIPRTTESLAVKCTRLASLALLSLALALTHQITPFLVGAAVIVLALFKIVRPWWTPSILLIPPAVWALGHFSAVRDGIPAGNLGDILGNVRVVKPTNSGIPLKTIPLLQVNFFSILGAFFVVALLALAALLQLRDRFGLSLCVTALSSLGLIAVTNYGDEGAFRVTLFALPFLVVAAARLRLRLTGMVSTVAVSGCVGVLALFSLCGEHGLDWYVAVKPGDLQLERAFEQQAPKDAVLVSLGYGPFVQGSTYRYVDYAHLEYDNISNLPRGGKQINPISADASVDYLTHYIAARYPRTPDQTYAVVSTTLEAQGVAYSQYSAEDYRSFLREIGSSPVWEQVMRTDTGILYRRRS